MKIKHLPIIVNPASGKPEPILSILNEAFKDSNITWDVLIVKKTGDAGAFAKELVKKKEHVVAVYGGDGTVMEVLSAMIGSPIPVAILPGGTANVMAVELGIPWNLKEGCEMLKQGAYIVKSLDIGEFNTRHFMLRTCLGFEADMVKVADRGTKNKFGRLAYVLSAIQAMKKIKLTQYDITVDREKHSVKGLTCILANSGSAGFGDLTLAKQIDVSDGMLDVIVIKKFDLSLLKYIWRVLFKGNPTQDRELVGHWQGKEITVTSKPQQQVVCDGEVLEKSALLVKVIPAAVRVLIPEKKTSSRH